MLEQEAEAGHSRDEGTLEWKLMQARSNMASLLHPPLPASAILHPLYSSSPLQTRFTRVSFQHQLQQVKATIRDFLEEATAVSLAENRDESGQLQQEAQSDVKAKKQRIISLVRENALHSTAITRAARQLQTTNHLDTLQCSLSGYNLSEHLATVSTLEEVKVQIQQFVSICETVAKELKMEAFADEHNDTAQGNLLLTHTLTLAASILVIDVEVFLELQNDTSWKPVIRLRLSYATDSTTSKVIQRDQSLGDCLKIDLQAMAEAYMGIESVTDNQVSGQDGISSMIHPQSRAKRTLETLKRLDDLSIALTKTSKESNVPDLFAALDDVGRKLHESMQSSLPPLEQIAAGGGLLMQHVGSPYASVVYHSEPDFLPTTIIEVTKEMNTMTLLPLKSKPRLHFIDITIAKSNLKVLQPEISSGRLPQLDACTADDAAILFTAVLHPPVMMSKESARRLSSKAGIMIAQGASLIKKLHRVSSISEAPSYEEMLSHSNINLTQEDSDDDLQFVPEFDLVNDTGKQGVIVSEFPFASLEHLSEATRYLRLLVQLNNLLCAVSPRTEASNSQGEATTLEDIMNDNRANYSPLTSQVSVVEEKGEIPTIYINAPLRIDVWTLEMKLFNEKGHWSIEAAASKIGSNHTKHSLEKDSQPYQESIALLEQKGGHGLKQVVVNIKSWAIQRVRGTVDGEQPAIEKPSEDSADQVKPLPCAKKISPHLEGREIRTRGRRDSVVDASLVATSSSTSTGVMTRRKSSAQSPTLEDRESSRRNSTISKRRASQAGIDDEDGSKRASRKKI